jgi:hypothetical protein
MKSMGTSITGTYVGDKRLVRYTGLATAVAALLTLGAAEKASAQPKSNEQPSTNAAAKVKFVRPATGAPSVRLTGGSRGIGDSTITVDVLAPDDVGLTTQEQPSLFWYQSKPAKAKFELTLLQENKAKPLVQVSAERAMTAGIQRVRLSDHGVKLSPGVEYQWVVALITDPDNRSSDLVASGVIKRIEASPELKKSIAAATPDALPGIYAEKGIWYDALTSLSDRIDADPGNKALQEARADLLRQAGLKAAATTPLGSN